MKPARFLPLIAILFLGLSLTSFAGEAARNTSKKNYVHTLTLADRLRVSVYQEDDLTTLTRVDARGKVNLPLIGEIAIGGMTVTEAQTAVENAYRDGRYLRNPQVTINVEEYAVREVSVSGQVRNPGRYQLPNETTYTLAELITKAGGVTDIGKGTAVSVSRILPDGSKKVFTIDVDSIIKGKKTASDDDTFLLHAGDNIYVPERLF